mmetsp:Transcript_110902/g.286708  ORF Transcript_110902/g.286708 Transcript_110902/m.286708 type:complete len:265 (+) Transcript_110902:622-1416(+)
MALVATATPVANAEIPLAQAEELAVPLFGAPVRAPVEALRGPPPSPHPSRRSSALACADVVEGPWRLLVDGDRDRDDQTGPSISVLVHNVHLHRIRRSAEGVLRLHVEVHCMDEEFLAVVHHAAEALTRETHHRKRVPVVLQPELALEERVVVVEAARGGGLPGRRGAKVDGRLALPGAALAGGPVLAVIVIGEDEAARPCAAPQPQRRRAPPGRRGAGRSAEEKEQKKRRKGGRAAEEAAEEARSRHGGLDRMEDGASMVRRR